MKKVLTFLMTIAVVCSAFTPSFSVRAMEGFEELLPTNIEATDETSEYEAEAIFKSGIAYPLEGDQTATLSTYQVASEIQVYDSIIAMKGQYPEGMSWTNDNYYEWRGGIYSGGSGCAGFAFLLSDAAFGDLPAREVHDTSNIRIGDILRVNNDTHSVIVIGVDGDTLTLAEGNYNHSIHWGRKLTIDEADIDYILTRYPEGWTPSVYGMRIVSLQDSFWTEENYNLSVICSLPEKPSSVSWSSSDENLATVNSGSTVCSAVLNTLKPGSVTITASSQGVSESTTITIEKGSYGLWISSCPYTLKVGDSGELTATFGLPSAKVPGRLRYNISNRSVLNVTHYNYKSQGDGKNGTITMTLSALKEGESTLTVQLADYSVNLTIKASSSGETAYCEAPDSGTENIQAFVTRIYEVGLDRTPEPAGLANWTNRLNRGDAAAVNIIQGVLCSQEYENKGKSNGDIVKDCYNSMLNRNPDEAGYNDWVSRLDCGMSVNAIFAGFVGSDEFGALCNQYEIAPGVYELTEARDKNEGITRFVSRLYTEALGRAYDTDGLNNWCSKIISDSSRGNILNVATDGFFHSQEFLNKNLNNTDFVKTCYRTFLGREAEQEGLSDWVGKLDRGELTRDQVMEGFAYSQEFGIIMASYGL